MTQKPRAVRSTEFVESLRKLRPEGFDLFAIYTHAYLESGNFQCPLTESSFNVWGIKGSYKGQSTNVPTFEYIDGKKVTINDDFRKYPSFDEAIQDYVQKITTMYQRAYNSRSNYKTYFQGLLTWEGKKLVYPSWSTSVTYADDLIRLYEKLKEQGDLYQIVSGQKWPNE